MKTIIVDRDKADHGYGRGRWWTREPKSAKPSQFRERGEVPEHLWYEYSDALKAEKRAHEERIAAEQTLNDAFRSLARRDPQ